MGCLTVDCQRRGLCLPRRDILDLTALESADLFIDSALQTCNLALVLFRLRLLARADELLVLIVRSLFCIVKAPCRCDDTVRLNLRRGDDFSIMQLPQP